MMSGPKEALSFNTVCHKMGKRSENTQLDLKKKFYSDIISPVPETSYKEISVLLDTIKFVSGITVSSEHLRIV